jgi:SNF2 family DNA or RNA helicase
LDGRGQVSDMSVWRWQSHWLNETQDTYWVKEQAKDSSGKKIWLSPGVPKLVPVQKTRKSYTEEKNPGALIAAMPLCIIHKRREYCCEFHPEGFLPLEEPLVSELTVELTAGQKRAIREMESEYAAWLGEDRLRADLTLTQKQRIRQMTLGLPHMSADETVEFAVDCESPKMDAVLDVMEQIDYEGTLIFTSSQRFATVATERLNGAGIPAAEYSGATLKTRDQSVEDLRSGKIKALVVVIAAGGTGLNLQFVSNEIWLDRDIDPVNNEQAEGRADRMGAARRVQRFILHDDLGYDQGQYSSELAKQLRLNQSFRLTSDVSPG